MACVTCSTRRGSERSSTRVTRSSGWISIRPEPARSSSATTASRVSSTLRPATPVVAPRGRRRRGVRERWAVGRLIADSSLVTLDAATGAQRREARPGRARRAGRGAGSERGRQVGDRRDPRQAAGARGRARDRGRIGRVKHLRAVTDAAFAPTGRLVASSGRDWAGRIWDTRTWREVREPLLGHNGQVLAIAFDTADTGRIATASTDQTARVWRLRTGRSFTTLFGHTGARRTTSPSAREASWRPPRGTERRGRGAPRGLPRASSSVTRHRFGRSSSPPTDVS